MAVTQKNLSGAIEELKIKFSNTHLNTIELGTIRNTNKYQLGQSTACISRALGEWGNLISVDININSIKASKKVCHSMSNITWVQSDSIVYLKELKNRKFHFAFLDTVPAATFKEFCLLIPMMIEGSVLMVDDAGITKDGSRIDTSIPFQQKGHEVWRFLKQCGANFLAIPYPNGFPGTQLKIVLDTANLELIKSGLSAKEK